MRVTFMVRKESVQKMAILSPVHQMSLHKNNYKKWRSNRMYKSVRYTHCSVFGFSKQFVATNLMAFLLISGFILASINEIDLPKQNRETNELEMLRQPAAEENIKGSEALTANETPEFAGGVPAFEICFKLISSCN